MSKVITRKRLLNGHHAIYCDGVLVAKAWRCQGYKTFGLAIDGVYWRNGVANTRSGLTSTRTKRLCDAIDVVRDYFNK